MVPPTVAQKGATLYDLKPLFKTCLLYNKIGISADFIKILLILHFLLHLLDDPLK